MPTIVGEHVVLRDVRREDAEDAATWPRFAEPELQWANVALRTPSERDAWFRHELSDTERVRLAVTTRDGELAGFLGLRDIDWRQRRATLGIRLSPLHVNQGLGTDAIRTLLRYAFETLDLARVDLDVAERNHRARRCYTKVGFSETSTHWGFDGQRYLDMSISRAAFHRHNGYAAEGTLPS
ncbi:MAG: GNAT family N-acetyltransferase [Chloroflexi bacterium]|nr:GNAT family N-acetyltransferase [Chloroflexota bacterium]